MTDQAKRRVIVVDDRLVPRLVQILEEELSIDQETFDIAEDTGASTEVAQARIEQVRALLNTIGPEGCTFCDDNQGRLDGRGCEGCNLLSTMIEDAVRVEGKPFPEDVGPCTHDDWGRPVDQPQNTDVLIEDGTEGKTPLVDEYEDGR